MTPENAILTISLYAAFADGSNDDRERLVDGFKISGFWTAFFASLFISILSMALGSLAPNAETTVYRLPPPSPNAISI